MALKTVILDFARYNHWANETLAGWLRTIDSGLIYKETKSSFTSIDLTLQHMKNAQNFWNAVISNADINLLDETIKINAFYRVIDELLQGSQKLIEISGCMSDDELLYNVSSPAITQKKYEFIIHVVNHNSYHRGQIITIGRSFDLINGVPNTDYEEYLWVKTPRGST